MDVQLKNAVDPILVKPSGSVIEVREVQEVNAKSPILVKLSGRLMEVRE